MKDVEQLLREAPASLPEPELDTASIRARARRSRHRDSLVMGVAGVVLMVAVIVGALQFNARPPTLLPATLAPESSQGTPSPSDGSDPAGDAAAPVLVLDSAEVRMQARIEGVLEVTEDGCVGIRHTNAHFALAAFPPGTTIDRDLVVTFPNGVEVRAGTAVVGGGGGYIREFGETMLPADLPDACRSLTLIQFYLED